MSPIMTSSCDNLDGNIAIMGLILRQPGRRIATKARLMHNLISVVVKSIANCYRMKAAGVISFHGLDVFEGHILEMGLLGFGISSIHPVRGDSLGGC